MNNASSAKHAAVPAARGPESSGAGARRAGLRPDVLWLLLAACALVAGLLGFRQPPDPDPFGPMPDPWSAQGLLHPIERNAFLRLPEIAGDLIDLAALPDGQQVWLLSADNAIAHSSDGGEHWEQLPPISEFAPRQDVAPGAPAATPVAAPSKAANDFALISSAQAAEPPQQLQSAEPAPLATQAAQQANPVRSVRQVRPPPPSTAQDALGYPDPAAGNAGTLLDLTQAPNAVNPAPQVQRRAADKTDRPAPVPAAPSKEPSTEPAKLSKAPPNEPVKVPSKGSSKEPAKVPSKGPSKEPAKVPASVPSTGEGTGALAAVPAPPMPWLSIGGIAFSDALHGVAVGTRSADRVRFGPWWAKGVFPGAAQHAAIILLTEDGGRHWTKVFEQASAGLRKLQMLGDGLGWAVGDDGLIVATRDGGRNWLRQDSASAATLTALSFIDAQHGWVASDTPSLLVTSDGGAHWTVMQRNPGEEWFSALSFGDALHGCAVRQASSIADLGGDLVCTRDGGRSWAVATPPDKSAPAIAVRFTDASHAVALVGAQSLVSSDAGASWQAAVSQGGSRAGVSEVLGFADRQHGWAVGSGGLVQRTDDGGLHWQPQTRGSGLQIGCLFFLDRQRGWAGAAGQGVLATQDGGATWQPLGGPPTATRFASVPRQIQFIDPLHGWVLEAGRVYRTDDGGMRWMNTDAATRERVLRFHFSDQGNGWMLTETLQRAASRDGGRSWQFDPGRAPVLPGEGRISDVTELAPGVSLAVDGSKGLWAQRGSDARWELTASGADWRGARRLEFADPARGWALRHDGILASADGGQRWSLRTVAAGVPLAAAALGPGASGWVVGAGGTVLHTVDDGLSWQSVSRPQGSAASLRAVWADPGGRQVVVAGEGALFASRDGGVTWDATRYRWYPAPWAWLALLGSVLASVRGWRASLSWQRRPQVVARAIEDRGTSDAAIDREDHDRLAFTPIARALARLLQNRNSDAPMVLAVTGKWGSGKSSLMNLLRGELRRSFNVRPVWFNAWHHQSEENLLSALLENIRQQAVPPLGSSGGLAFRYALGLQRLRAHCLPALGWLGLGLFVLAYLDTAPPERLGAWFGLLGQLVKDGDAAAQGVLVGNASRVLVALVAIFKISAGLRAFGVNPATLMASTSQNFKLRDASAQAGFRFQFEREFAEVTLALEHSDRRMVIFIDDLDRCQPEKVVQVLESINFLVSAGRCFVILGMDREYIVSAVGLSFERIATEMAEQSLERPAPLAGALVEGETDTSLNLHRRQQFAERYVQKMLNIEIPIPGLDLERAAALFLDEPAKAPPPAPRFSWAGLRATLAGLRGLLRALLLVALLAAAWKAGTCLERYVAPVPAPLPGARPSAPALTPGMAIQWRIEAQPDGSALVVPKAYPEPAATAAAPSAPAARVPADASAGAGTAARAGPSAVARTPGQDGAAPGPTALAVAPGLPSRPEWPIGLPLLPVLLVLLTAAYVLSRARRQVIEDSPEFEQARRIWSALVIRRSRNPREIKRFNNRVRYFAMRLANDALAASAHGAEALLVALAALHYARGVLDPAEFDWLAGVADTDPSRGTAPLAALAIDPLADPGIDSALSGDDSWPGESPPIDGLDAVARDCVARHRAAGLAWPPSAQLIERFQRWSQGIVT